jgi:membrane-bound metal-dependent hydrolase YbcI (DUF457 family)
MDPVSHLAFGRIAIALDQDRRLGPSAVGACLAGSLAPDVDAVFMPRGWDIYLLHHQGGTHSLIGSVASAALAAGLVKTFSRRARFASVLLAAWAGAVGHVLLDLISGADIRLWWPFGRRTALPLFAMADPWLGGVLLLGLLFIFARPGRARQTASLVLVGLVMLGAAKAGMYGRARQLANRNDRPIASRADVEWGSLTRWDVYQAYADAVDARRVDIRTGLVVPLMHVPRNLDHQLVERSLQFDTVRNFIERHDITFAVIPAGTDSSAQVLWSDLRYCGESTAGSLPWSPTAPARGLHMSCALWFGGDFEPVSGAPHTAIVYVGRIVQRRPARPRDNGMH